MITVGCGDVTKVAPLIVAELAQRGDPRLEEPDEFYRDRDPTGRAAGTGRPTGYRRPDPAGVAWSGWPSCSW